MLFRYLCCHHYYHHCYLVLDNIRWSCVFSSKQRHRNGNKIKTSTNYEFLNFDNRRSKDGDENCSCSSWGFLGIEAFEFMVIGIFIIFLVVKGIRRLCGEGGYIQKRKEMKWKRDAEKFEKLKSKFETKAETKGPEPDNIKGAATNTDRVAIVLWGYLDNDLDNGMDILW